MTGSRSKTSWETGNNTTKILVGEASTPNTREHCHNGIYKPISNESSIYQRQYCYQSKTGTRVKIFNSETKINETFEVEYKGMNLFNEVTTGVIHEIRTYGNSIQNIDY